MAQVRRTIASDHGLDRKLDKIGWGSALIWVGAAIILNIGWETGLLGLGAITLLGQMLRRYLAIRVDWFAVALGIFFCLIGLKLLFHLRLGEVGLFPILTIALGSAFLISALFGSRSD